MEGIEDNKNKRVPDLKSKSHKGRFGKVSYAIEVEEDQNSPKHISPYDLEEEEYGTRPPSPQIEDISLPQNQKSYAFGVVSREKREQLTESMGKRELPGVWKYNPKFEIIHRRRPHALILEEKEVRPTTEARPSPVCRKMINFLNNSENKQSLQSPMKQGQNKRAKNRSFDMRNLQMNDPLNSSLNSQTYQSKRLNATVGHTTPSKRGQTGICPKSLLGVPSGDLIPDKSRYHFPNYVLYNRRGNLSCEATNIIDKLRPHLGGVDFTKIKGRKYYSSLRRPEISNEGIERNLMSMNINGTAIGNEYSRNKFMNVNFEKQIGRNPNILISKHKIPTVLCYDTKEKLLSKGMISFDKMIERSASKFLGAQGSGGELPSPESTIRAMKHLSHFNEMRPTLNMHKSPGRDNKMYERLERDRMDKFKYSIQAKLAILQIKQKLKPKRNNNKFHSFGPSEQIQLSPIHPIH